MSSCAGATGVGAGVGEDVILGEVRFGFDVIFGTVVIRTLEVTITHHLYLLYFASAFMLLQ